MDQVTHPNPPDNSSTHGDVLGGFSCFPDCGAGDRSVPIYNAYNHHYFGWLINADAQVYEAEHSARLPNPTRTAVRSVPHNYTYPTSIVFKENPGGEFRKSYHGYPSGFGQFIYSPTQWIVEPMQIDTHHRAYNITDPVGYKPFLLPKAFSNNMTDVRSGLSPLIECPCTDRITRTLINTSAVIISGTCPARITSSSACTTAAAALASIGTSATVNDPSLPTGCLMMSSAKLPHTYDVVFNTVETQHACGSPGETSFTTQADWSRLVYISVRHDGHVVNITLSGPDGA